MEAMEAERRNGEAMQADRLRNMSLYICTLEDYTDWKCPNSRYRIQAIKLSDLLSYSSTPITVFSSKSRSKSKVSNSLVRDVAFVEGDLPWHMSFGVFGSRILLAGGCKSDRGTTGIYVLETDPTVEPRPKFIKGPGKQQRKAKPQYAIPKFNGGKSSPFMVEWNHILVYLMIVSTESEIYSIEPLAEISVPYGFKADSYSCADLGGGAICFVLMNLGEYVKMPVLFMTFQFSFLKYAASSDSSSGSGSPHFSSSTGSPRNSSSSSSDSPHSGSSSGNPHSGGSTGSDPDFLCRVLSDIRSFTVKSLGCRIFEYNWSEESSHPLYPELLACFVL
ncbi:hypothetical protein M0R45_018654 [Rubus argutus]|uniref:Uncharacterized protein n=1 Tax=Rubus argutus TaxID=59490 RepID=A0AAW1X5R4_RUBAR